MFELTTHLPDPEITPETSNSENLENQDFKRAMLLSQMAQTFDSLLSKADSSRQIMAQACQLFHSSAAFVMEYDAENANFLIIAAQGLDEAVSNRPIELSARLRQQVLEEGQLVFSPNIAQAIELVEIQSLLSQPAPMFIAAPVDWRGTRIGLLGVYPEEGWGLTGNLSPNEQAIIRSAADIIGQVLFNARLIQESENARNDFTDMLVYGLKGPMASIMGALDLLYDMQGPDAQAAQLLTIARRNGARMLTMIETLLDLNKLERGEIQLDLERARLHQLVQIAQQALEDQFRAKGLYWKNVLPEETILVHLDISRMLKVLHHLLDNALNFTDSGQIEIMAEKRQNAAGREVVVVAVSDTGMGIEADRLRDLFDRFSRARQYRQLDLASGGGLGLNYAKLVVHAHGGEIWAESPGRLGCGSTFYFTLPLK